MKSQTTQFNFQQQLHRRAVLRGSGVAMGLPWLSAMRSAFARESDGDDRPRQQPLRFMSVTVGLGLVSENWMPQDEGKQFTPSRYLRSLSDLRDRLTVASGVSHPDVTGGHRAEASILTGTPMGSAGRAVNTISIDQLLAKHLGNATRFPSLVLATGGSNSPCYTESGATITPTTSAATLFADLFIDDSQQERTKQAARVRQGRSIMDVVAEDARSLQRTLGRGDRDRLDAYFTSVRGLEQRMQQSEAWARRPKPEVDADQPIDVRNPNDLIGRFKTMCDVVKLALQTDSSRFITLHLPGTGGVVPIDGVDQAYHSLSHHGLDETKLSQLAIVEEAIVSQWGDFMRSLAQVDDAHGSLLDDTTSMLTSNLGNASNHSNQNMPVMIGGGPFSHAGHLAFSQKNNYPLANFYVSVLQKFGLEIDQFASSTGTMNGLS
ncbi:DUF1552 domain-containing protein [Allorhodopirellula heiligendammensis]|uniref:Secreted protein containing DUF1552 n=1 Tax=Allorhodopirellula heiligendammensis TaxID=2714739 RepID=A0A5C6BVF6_9BACT|nr:DUF1552 domain-containing protein [Allorhodopirellula heiligendammensis]TWU16263.1 hypothetical protein Poly21_34680 [Allorhodopirellula heiligendammensis]